MDHPTPFRVLANFRQEATTHYAFRFESFLSNEEFVRYDKPSGLARTDPLDTQHHLDPVAPGRVFLKLGDSYDTSDLHSQSSIFGEEKWTLC